MKINDNKALETVMLCFIMLFEIKKNFPTFALPIHHSAARGEANGATHELFQSTGSPLSSFASPSISAFSEKVFFTAQRRWKIVYFVKKILLADFKQNNFNKNINFNVNQLKGAKKAKVIST